MRLTCGQPAQHGSQSGTRAPPHRPRPVPPSRSRPRAAPCHAERELPPRPQGRAHRGGRRRDTPVNCSNWPSAWASSRSSPDAIRQPSRPRPRPAASATGRRSRRRTPCRAATRDRRQLVRDALRHRRDHHVGVEAPSPLAHPRRQIETPSAAATGASSSIASGRRATTVTVRGTELRRRRQRRAGRAAGAQDGDRGARGHAGLARSTRDHARDVGVLGVPGPSGRRTRVLAAPTAAATGDASAATVSADLLERHRQRQPGPLRAEPRDQVRQLGLGAFDRGVRPVDQPGRGVAGVVDHRRQRVAIGLPSTAARHTAPLQHAVLPCRGPFLRCSEVVANAEWPCLSIATKYSHSPGRRLHRALQRRLARVVDRRRAGPGRRACCTGSSGRSARQLMSLDAFVGLPVSSQ